MPSGAPRPGESVAPGRAALPTSAVVRMEDVRRTFGPTVALDGASLSLAAAEVHAVLGANGAGKTTLLSILAGLTQPDAGRILLRGAPVQLPDPRAAWAAGIGMVHQHFTLVPALSVLENLALGASGLRLRLDALASAARELIERTGLRVPLDAAVESLGVGDRQRVEILKVLLRRPDVLILDEPTSVLAPIEVERLLALLRTLAAGGTTVVLVAHKLDEVLWVADRLTVLRAGRTVLEAERKAVDAGALVHAMVGSGKHEEAVEVASLASAGAEERAPTAAADGRTASGPANGPPAPAPATAPPDRTPPASALDRSPAARASDAPVIARLSDASVQGTRGEPAVVGVSLEVRRGEVVGIAGVEGNGQRELAQLLSGRIRPASGTADVPADPSYIPQDRSREGLVRDFTLTENVALALHRQPQYRRGPWVRWGALRERTRELLAAFSVKAESSEATARELSGGNQQRVVVARELGRSPALLVAENPTRGLDVTAAAFVHERLRALPDAAVVLLSTDLDEVLRLSDRVYVMVRGRLLEVPEKARTREGIGRMMLTGAAQGS